MEYPRFVILKYSREGRPLHWDMMLEAGKVLHTWRLDVHPSHIDDEHLAVTRISDRPPEFLDHQAPTSDAKGLLMEVADSGFFRNLGSDTSGKQLVEFNGKILKDRFTLEHISGDQWLMTRLPD